MNDFFQEHATKLYWLIGVLIPCFILFIAVGKGEHKIIKKAKSKGYYDFSFIKLISRILRVFIILFVLLFLTYFFVDKSNYAFVTENIRAIAWLTFVSVFTIISSKLSSTIFNRIIQKKLKKMVTLHHINF
jgi:uncharacterized BrkB/YihY/UPF0761 family membrane protein